MAETVSVPMTEEVARRLRSYVEAGVGDDESDIVTQALSLLDADDARRLADVQEKVRRSLDDPRPSVPADKVFAEVRALLSK